MSSEIKLDVGKKYHVRDPSECKRLGQSPIVKILSRDKSPAVTYKGDDGYHYFPDGWLNQYQESPFDLVREVTP